jgi:SAM-dependent methyltransferase
MQNQAKWRASKFMYRNGKLIGSRDPGELAITSRLVTDLVASFYDRYLRDHAKGRLLDVGCGKVPLYAVYREFVTTVTCVDWNNNEYLDYELDLTRPFPFRNQEFDTIIVSDVLEHIPTSEQFFKEISRVLSKNGKLLMNVPFYYPLRETPYDYYRYTEFALRRFAQISGLTLLQLNPIGGTPEIIADIFAKNIRRTPIVGSSLACAIQWFVAVFVSTRFGRRISAITGNRFPLGYFLIAEKSHCS